MSSADYKWHVADDVFIQGASGALIAEISSPQNAKKIVLSHNTTIVNLASESARAALTPDRTPAGIRKRLEEIMKDAEKAGVAILYGYDDGENAVANFCGDTPRTLAMASRLVHSINNYIDDHGKADPVPAPTPALSDADLLIQWIESNGVPEVSCVGAPFLMDIDGAEYPLEDTTPDQAANYQQVARLITARLAIDFGIRALPDDELWADWIRQYGVPIVAHKDSALWIAAARHLRLVDYMGVDNPHDDFNHVLSAIIAAIRRGAKE